jgi:hypothetical protein
VGIFILGVAFALFVLDFYALGRIITKAGFSAWWVCAPLAPFILAVILWIAELVDLRAFIVGDGAHFGNLEPLAWLWFLSGVFSWIMYLVFAFSEWPVQRQGASSRRDPPRPTTGSFSPAPPPAAGPVAPGAPDAEAHMAEASAPGAVAIAPPLAPAVAFCTWCGRRRDPDAIAIHHCGPKDRPAVHCTGCGGTLEETPFCAACGAPRPEVGTSR